MRTILYNNNKIMSIFAAGLFTFSGSLGTTPVNLMDQIKDTPVIVDTIDTASDKTEVKAIATPEKKLKKLATSYQSNATSYAATSTPVYSAPASNYITIGGRTVSIEYSNTTEYTPAVNAAYLNGSKFIYGHNSGTTFGHIAGLPVGTTFSVNLGGTTKTYRIANTVTLEKNSQVAPKMRAIVNAQYNGASYDLSIMTCAGTSYGNGDASHRTIVFAVAV